MIDPAAPTRVEQFQGGGALERTAANEQVEAAAAAETIFKARMSDSLMDPFHVLKRTRKPTKLEPWISAAMEGNSAAFAAVIATNQRGTRYDRRALVQWSSRRSGHTAEGFQTTAVQPLQTRSAHNPIEGR